MKIAKLIAWIALLAMTAVLLNGFVNGNFGEDGSALLSNPWGIVSLVDLYAGFFLFSIWIAFRERSVWAAVLWIVLMMVLGFFTGSLYVLILLYKSKGDWLWFFLGARKEKLMVGNPDVN
jgi:hypothetical protein